MRIKGIRQGHSEAINFIDYKAHWKILVLLDVDR